jgi:hypothetical protein
MGEKEKKAIRWLSNGRAGSHEKISLFAAHGDHHSVDGRDPEYFHANNLRAAN